MNGIARTLGIVGGVAVATAAVAAGTNAAVRACEPTAASLDGPDAPTLGWRRFENERPAMRRPDGGIEWRSLAVPFVSAAAVAGVAAFFRSPIAAVGAGLVAGGLVANSTEFAARGSVTDYVRIPGPFAFNVADAAFGVGALVLTAGLVKAVR